MLVTKTYNKIYDNIPDDWESKHGWYYYADAIRCYGSTQTHYTSRASTTVKYCLKCNRQWQLDSKKIQYYNHLPTYKMTRMTCRDCEGKHDKR